MSTELCQPRNQRHARTQKRRSASFSRGRGFWRFRTRSGSRTSLASPAEMPGSWHRGRHRCM